MTSKKNSFWTFVFSLWPGAAEMYMGFFKQGFSLMGLFLLILFLATWLDIGPLLFVLPLIWCYGFFHANHLRSLPDEEFYAIEDGYLFELDNVVPTGQKLSKKARNILAGALILIGGVSLLNRLMGMLYDLFPSYLRDWYWDIWHNIPQVVFAVLMVSAGIWLIQGKKRELAQEEEQEQGKDGEQP